MIDSYKTLPLGKYIDIMQIPRNLSEVDFNVKVVSILIDKPEDEVLDLPLPEFQKAVAAAQFLAAPVLGKDGRKPYDGKRVADTYILGGFKLKLTKEPAKMNVAQYVDFQTFAKGDVLESMPQLLSCVLIPEGKTYNEGYDVAEVHKAIRENLPTSDAYALSAFFLRNFLQSTRNILTSSLHQLRRKKNKTEKDKELIRKTEMTIVSLHGGAGLRTWMRLLNSPTIAGLTSGRRTL